MSAYTTVRGKVVSLGGITLDVAADGELTILADGQELRLPEARASALHDLMADVMEWASSAGMTDAQLERDAVKADAEHESGKADDERAHEGR